MDTAVPQPVSHGRQNVSVLVAEATRLTGRLGSDALRRDRSLTIIDATERPVLPLAIELKPDVAFIMCTFAGDSGGGFELLSRIRESVPATRVVMLLDSSDREPVVEAFRAGARGLFCRCDSLKMLSRCVHKVQEGELWVNSIQLEFMLETLAEAPATQLVDTRGISLLSSREQDVVRWLVEGFTNREIAQQLKISANTVKNYFFRFFNKLGVSSRTEVAIYAANQRAANNPPDIGRFGDSIRYFRDNIPSVRQA